MVHFKLRDGRNNLAELLSDQEFKTPVRNYVAEQLIPARACKLEADGTLTVREGFVWDFGTGAIDTPDVLEPSLVHDAFCDLTDGGLLPWSCRKQADKLFYTMLRDRGCGWLRAQYLYWAVRFYSKVRGLRH